MSGTHWKGGGTPLEQPAGLCLPAPSNGVVSHNRWSAKDSYYNRLEQGENVSWVTSTWRPCCLSVGLSIGSTPGVRPGVSWHYCIGRLPEEWSGLFGAHDTAWDRRPKARPRSSRRTHLNLFALFPECRFQDEATTSE